MAPEQAKGKPVDRRADIWGFGCVLYEMLAGRRAFGGEDVPDTLAEVIKGEPDWTKLPAETPAPIRRLLQQCLVKDRSRRLADIADARFELEEAQAGVSAQSDRPQAASRRLERLAWAAALVTASGVAAALAFFARPTPTVPEMRVEIPTPPTNDPISFAISPDGSRMVLVGATSGRPQLWLRSLDAASAQPLAGTEGATLPFWAPHGRSIGFFADDGWLKRIDLAGGEVRMLANAPLPRGGTWNGEDTILFVPGTGPVFRVPASGGEPTQVTRLGPSEPLHGFPSFLPDGEHFIYFVGGDSTTRGIHLAALSAPEGRRLLEVDSPAVFAPPDHLLVVRAGRLLAQRLDPARWDVAGSALPVAESIAMGTIVTRPVAAVSASGGHIAYRSGWASPKRQFAWFDRTGRELERLGNPDEAEPLSPSLSPDGRRLAMHRSVDGNIDIWMLETGRGALSRFTSHVANEIHPLWSPDGSRLLFSSNRTGAYDLYEKSTTGPADETLVMPVPTGGCTTGCSASDWSPDGRFMLFERRGGGANFDIWILSLAAGERPFPYLETEFDERDPQFAPDGRWIAYSSTESGRSEVYVQRFPGRGARVPISVSGGAQPRWRADGKELFFIGLDDRLMAVPVILPSDGGSFDAGTPVALFATDVGGAVHRGSRQQYVVSRDGQRFLMNTVVEETASTSITLIANWRPQEAGARE
jgi:Tol biopolymer transport system component